MSDRHEILDPNELIGGVVLRAQTAANNVGETMTITIPAVSGGERPNAARCRNCGRESSFYDSEWTLMLKVFAWENYCLSMYHRDGKLAGEPDWISGPEEGDGWTGNAVIQCDNCYSQSEFEFNPNVYDEREHQIAEGFLLQFEVFYSEEFE